MNWLVGSTSRDNAFILYESFTWSLQVDKHIRRLDSDLARFETEIKEKSSATALSAEEDTPPAAKSKLQSHVAIDFYNKLDFFEFFS